MLPSCHRAADGGRKLQQQDEEEANTCFQGLLGRRGRKLCEGEAEEKRPKRLVGQEMKRAKERRAVEGGRSRAPQGDQRQGQGGIATEDSERKGSRVGGRLKKVGDSMGDEEGDARLPNQGWSGQAREGGKLLSLWR